MNAHEPDLLPPPSADYERWRADRRRHNVITAIIAAPLLVLAAVAAWAAFDGRGESSSTGDTVELSLADNSRSACITERRNLEIAAIGDQVTALGRAQSAYFIEGNADEARAQVLLFEAAGVRREAATYSLSDEVVDLPPPAGCGPPVVDSSATLPTTTTLHE